MRQSGKTGAARTRRLTLEQLEERIAPAGGIFAWQRGGLLVIDGDNLDNDILLDQAGLGPGEFRVSSGPDATEINGQAGPLVFDGVTSAIHVRLSGGDDIVAFQDSQCPQRVLIDGGQGNNTASALSSDFEGDLLIKNRNGNSLVQLDDVALGRNLIIRNGNGSNETSLQGFFGGNILISNGNGTSLLDVADSTVYGRVNAISRNADSVSIFENVAVIRGINLRGGNGDDAVLFDGVETLGRISVINGHGDSMTGVVGGSVLGGSFTLRNGTGNDELEVAGSTIEGRVVVNNGHGNSRSEFNGSDVGFDSVTGRASDLILRSGNGEDEFTLADTVVARNVNVNLANGGSLSFVTDSGVGGNLLLRSSSGADAFVMEYSAIFGNLIVNTGNDGDGVWIDDSLLSRGTTLNMGNGADAIALDTVTDAGYEDANVFEGRVLLSGGAGNDDFFLGVFGAAGASSEFDGPVIVNGGPGYDYLDVVDNGNIFLSVARDIAVEEIV